MKIFLISNMYPSQKHPGYGVFVQNVCDGMAKHDIHVAKYAVIKGRGIGILDKIGKYISFYGSIIKNYFADYDCMYIHFPNQASPILSLLQRLKKKPMVLNYHAEDLLYDEQSWYLRHLGHTTDELAKKATFIVVPSLYFKDIVVERGLNHPDKVVVSPSGGINDQIFYYNGEKSKHDHIHLGFVGRLERDKGVLEFIEACCQLSNSIDVKATIIGYGPLNDVVSEKTKGNKIFTVKFGVPQSELPSYYRDFDLFCFPSSRKAESLGLVGIEAMGCGTPILGGDIGGIKSYVKHGENGYLLRLDHLTEDMVAYSKEYYNKTDEQKKSMIDSAVMTATNYSREKVCEKLAAEFKQRVNE